jgi:transposase, IS5 family
MRKSVLEQLSLTPAPIDHVHAQELMAVGVLLDRLPAAVALVHDDLSIRHGRRVDPAKGRDGMAAEQVLRVAILKQRTGLSYERLAFALADSNTYRRFCRLGYEQKPPTKSALQKNVKRVSVATWEKINQMVVHQARDLGVEKGTKVRTDCLVVESNIHPPTDSSLLWDCVRVLCRLMKRAKRAFGLQFVNHRLRAKRRALEISNATSKEQRKPLYRDLLAVAEHTLEQAQQIAKQLGDQNTHDMHAMLVSQGLIAEIEHFVPLANQVVSQTERRVMRDEAVPATEKIVSIFEPHTSIIVKDNRKDNHDTEYGHKVCLTAGASTVVTDVVVEQGNPADYVLATKMIERQQTIFGQPPRQASFDGGFAGKSNLVQIKALGVTDVVFHKRRGLEIAEMASSTRVYKKLRGFRAGIEGIISFLKRGFGLERCTWRSFDSFKAYVQVSVLACNLLVIARRLLPAAG